MSNDSTKNDSPWSVAVRWLFGQEANTVALFLIIGALFYFSPEALKRIQAGYEKIEVNQTEQVKTIVDQHEKSDQRMSGLLRDILDLQRKRYDEETAAAARTGAHTGRPPDASRPN